MLRKLWLCASGILIFSLLSLGYTSPALAPFSLGEAQLAEAADPI